MKKAKKQTAFGKYFYIIPIIIMIVLIVLAIVFRQYLTADNIINYTPKNKFLSAILITLLFGVKGLSVMFPGTVLYVVTGMIFPAWLAGVVALAGTALEIMITYWMGLLCGETKLVKKVQQKPKFIELFEKGHKNEYVLVYLSRIIGLPYDVMGMFWGTVRAKFLPYVFFSMLGKLPKVIIETFLGHAAGRKITPKIVITFSVLVLFTVLVTIISNKLFKKKDKEDSEKSDSSKNNDSLSV